MMKKMARNVVRKDRKWISPSERRLVYNRFPIPLAANLHLDWQKKVPVSWAHLGF